MSYKKYMSSEGDRLLFSSVQPGAASSEWDKTGIDVARDISGENVTFHAHALDFYENIIYNELIETSGFTAAKRQAYVKKVT